MHYEPDLEALRVLALVAKEGSMSAASAQLGVSQQAISLRIRNLEKDLRMRLLVRSARGSRLTPTGELVVGWGTTLLTAADEFSDAVTSLRTDRGKMMRIAASLTIAEHLLPDWIARWRISHGNDGPVVQLTAANSSTVVEAIREGTADLGRRGHTRGNRRPRARRDPCRSRRPPVGHRRLRHHRSRCAARSPMGEDPPGVRP